jgi:hypothetical protein
LEYGSSSKVVVWQVQDPELKSKSIKKTSKQKTKGRKNSDLGFLALPYVVFPPYCNNSTC